ncbi:hypothetical protein ABT095_15475 [Kitasatospora sp. NPDC002227]|uniref:hypothetical protein n=1 Tax=Kitasatospora sp. NPDC002227 TaxID=3154773 RepID=UPI00332DFEE4
MDHQMRAEYGPRGADGGVKTWHIVAEDPARAMCGRELSPEAETLSPAHWGDDPGLSCHTCGALLLRESPYLPAEHEEGERRSAW